MMCKRGATISAFAIMGMLALFGAGCGSSSGAKCPDAPPEKPPGCPVCTEAPRPGPKPIEIPAATLTTDREQRVSLIAFSQDGATALLRIEDASVGNLFKTVDLNVTPVPKLIKTWLFQAPEEAATLKLALRALKSQAPGPASAKNKAGVSLVAADDGERIVVLAMKGERSVPIATLPRLRDEDGVLADVSLTKLAWDPTGARAVLIHAQKLAAAPGFESDWVHVIAVDPASLPF